ncbi:hypothetical protein ACWT_1467 [Actinoplanes sp. SE50]|uniref:hypothetical protein n=1 Tax=unclassified Actinoplanes TaxID=2626549 RepID=UPI00023EC3FC|nr:MULTISPECIES: hypothetical protein [unclassified Actinoplanes]AEV82485.1 hypothetical protein ACPL_1588 [Actinoplanes sp. SE50/110]ATO80882.1 hypothetical protein ACWT_1467 [Actinoplanes sp. SE50]SLL98289.1 hypothetical protein ACSP50_1515 [Actinoplanes sp. SE50/110]
MTHPLARTRQEAHLFIDLTPCACGDRRLATAGEPVTLPDGNPGRRYAGRCPTCGRDREFVFAMPAVPEDSTSTRQIVYGYGTRPSRLLGPGQWLWAAEQYAEAVPRDPEHLTGEARATARTWLMAAVAAVREAAKFLPDGADRLPPGDVPAGRDPDDFTRQRLIDRRLGYERRLRALPGDPPPPRDPEQVRRQLARNRAVEAWAARHGLADPVIGAGTAEQNREIDRELRRMDGLDPETGLDRDSAAAGFAAFRQFIDDLEIALAADVPARDLRIGTALAAYQAWLDRLRISDGPWRDALWAGDIWQTPDTDLPPAAAVWEMVEAARSAVRSLG